VAPEAGNAEGKLQANLQRWADGKATLKEVRGYTDDQIYAVTKTAWFYYHQGKVAEARTLFQGLFAVDPGNGYVARALGVVEFASGNREGALAAWDVAVKLEPEDPAGYVGRAEVKLSSGQKGPAVEDLKRAQQLARGEHPLKPKISGMLAALSKK
jgi:tetratricopeptide (TPR) repeat protein